MVKSQLAEISIVKDMHESGLSYEDIEIELYRYEFDRPRKQIVGYVGNYLLRLKKNLLTNKVVNG